MLRYTVCSVLHYASVLVALYSVFCATEYKCSCCIVQRVLCYIIQVFLLHCTACSVLHYTSVLVALYSVFGATLYKCSCCIIQRVLCYIIQVFLLHYTASSVLHNTSVLVAFYSVFCATLYKCSCCITQRVLCYIIQVFLLHHTACSVLHFTSVIVALYSVLHPAICRVSIMHYTECVCCIIRVFYVYGALQIWSHVALNSFVHATLHKEPMLHVQGSLKVLLRRNQVMCHPSCSKHVWMQYCIVCRSASSNLGSMFLRCYVYRDFNCTAGKAQNLAQFSRRLHFFTSYQLALTLTISYFSDTLYYSATNITNGFRRILILGNRAQGRQKVFP